MQAIITKFLPATNFKGSRIKAECDRGSITVSHPHELSGEAVHEYAVKQLIAKFVKEDEGKYGSDPKGNPWNMPMVSGGLPQKNSHAMCFVFVTPNLKS